LHVGPTSEEYLLDCFGRVEELEPELIVITGDYMTWTGRDEVEQVGQILSQLPPTPLGIIGTLGNHDYGKNWKDTRIGDALAQVVIDCGVKLLRNQCIDVAGLQVIGMDDLWAGQFQPEEALAGFDPKRASLVLSHNPDTVDRSGWGGYQGWILSGHTHGGQCNFPLFGRPFVPVDNPRYTAGQFDLSNGRRLYINRGLGYNRRVRFNARPEITAFTLRRVDRLA
jgi:predicted MPP superfamily phosphohydrolase